MGEENIQRLVKSIPDGKAASITLTNTEGARKKYNCVFKESIAPSFFLLLKDGTCPSDIDMDRQCLVESQDQDGTAVSFAAMISDKTRDRLFELEAKKSLRPEDLREFFRVNITTPITVSFMQAPGDTQTRTWEISGETVDLSQSGTLALFPKKCLNDGPLMLEITLPNPEKEVSCIAHVILKRQTRKGKWLTSFHFDNISTKDRDVITQNCFSQQRKQLRENIETAG